MRQIQELRKTAKFTPADKIAVYCVAEGELRVVIKKNRLIIAKETKAADLEFKKPDKTAAAVDAKIAGQPIWLGIKKC
jgi:hypothetical protein